MDRIDGTYNVDPVDDDLTQCRCGHTLEDHHISWWAGGGRLVEECEFFGFNEDGGKNLDGSEHCMTFKAAR